MNTPGTLNEDPATYKNVFNRLYKDFAYRQQLKSAMTESPEAPPVPKYPIEDIIRKKHINLSTSNSTTSQLQLESQPISNFIDVHSPKFRPRVAEINIFKLEQQIRDLEDYSKPKPQPVPARLHMQHSGPVAPSAKTTLQAPQRTSIQQLREQVKSRFSKQHEEPLDLLDMGVLQRNEFWAKLKLRKIEEARKKKADNELNGCTFKPDIKPRRTTRASSVISNLSTYSKRAPSVCSSYAELQQNRRADRARSQSRNSLTRSLSSRNSYRFIHGKRHQDNL